MRKNCIVLLGVVCTLMIASAIQADTLFNLAFDEEGNGLPMVTADPLTYELPFSAIAGDVAFWDPWTNAYGDLVHFNGDDTVTWVWSAGGGDNAPDKAAYPGLERLQNALLLTEQGNETYNYVDYSPSLEGWTVGYNLGFYGNEIIYHMVSEGTVPEPSTFTLLGMGAVGLLAYAWRRRK
jgi:hypothetical protein